jgi:hypothetical protein
MNYRNILRNIIAIATVLVASIVGAKPPEGVLDTKHAHIRAVMAVQHEVTPNLMNWDGVLGTAVGLDDNDQPSLVVYVDQESASKADVIRALPPQLRGIGVKVELTDKFRALAKPSGTVSVVSHKAKQTPPIQLGTSGSWGYDLANGYCCGGTLGSLIQANGNQYVLSNYHVFESDIVSGGNGIVAETGNPIIQPGLIDVSCRAANAQTVAALVKVSSLPNNNVDCSVAQVVSGMVRTDGAILEIGTLSSQTVAPSINKAVKKSGRTTGLTRSKIVGLNATVSVTYDNECAGGTAFTKTFTGQIMISNLGSQFLNSGDSGSLMVEDVTTKPRAIGLLYAGSSSRAVANPIGEVLTFIGSKLGGTATMVGN